MRVFGVKLDAICWVCRINIDPDFKISQADAESTTADIIKEMVEFWTGWEEWIENANGDYIKAFALQLAKECFHIAYSNNYNTLGVIAEFEDMEGYCKMDGSNGIWIVHTDDATIDDFEFSTSELVE